MLSEFIEVRSIKNKRSLNKFTSIIQLRSLIPGSLTKIRYDFGATEILQHKAFYIITLSGFHTNFCLSTHLFRNIYPLMYVNGIPKIF